MSKQVLIDALKAIGLRAVDANQARRHGHRDHRRASFASGEQFSIPGFGTFAVSNRAARMGRNPRTGEEIKIQASKGVRFKAREASFALARSTGGGLNRPSPSCEAKSKPLFFFASPTAVAAARPVLRGSLVLFASHDGRASSV